MILRRLDINRLPGIDDPFEIEPAEQGIQVVFGPNGIGKSSICRAVARLYWDELGSSRQTTLRAEFEWDGEIWRAEREGSTVRWSCGDDGNFSPGLPASHNYRCFFLELRDLIDPSRNSTADIASEIRRQMSGGFDLRDIRSDFFPAVTPRRKRQERRRYNTATENVQKAEAEQSGLQQRVDQLDELRVRLNEADAAKDRLAQVQRAIDLAERRDRLADIRSRREVLPDALARLTGKESEEVAQYQEQLKEIEQRARELEMELENAHTAQEEAKLSGALDEADLATWRDQAGALERLELKLDSARTERAASRDKLVAALNAVGGNLIDNAALSLPRHGELLDFLRLSQTHSSRADAIRERLRLLEGVDSPTEDEQDLERFRDAVEALRSWIRAPESDDSIASRVRNRLQWLVTALALAIVGTGLGYLLDPVLIYLAAVGIGIGLAAAFARGPGGSSGRKQADRARYEDLGLEQPAGWDIDSVKSTLRSLESSTARLEASLKRSRDRNVEITTLRNQLEDLVEQASVLDARRQELTAKLGMQELPPDAELVNFTWALDQLRQACGEYEAVTGKLQHLESNYYDRLAKLADVLENRGEPRPDSAAGIKARLNNLALRNSRLEGALVDERRAKDLLERNAVDGEKSLNAISSIYSKSDLQDGDMHGLVSLLEELPGYRELSKQADYLHSQNELERNGLEQAGESGLAEMDARSLEQLASELKKSASRAPSLREEIADTRVRMDQARQGRAVQELIAAREDAHANLRDLRDEALFAMAGEFLIEEVEQEFEATRIPRVFERAREHFYAFTFHNYELRVDRSAEAPRLFAVDSRTRQRRELEELSDGTRVQLLLAARIAFAEEVEQGKVLPLFLDEALDQSDPERFAAIVRSLGSVAQNHRRQIFYLTSDPLDVQRIREALSEDDCALPEPIDLGLIRKRTASIIGPQALAVSPRQTIPEPDGLSPEDYGAAIGVPAFRPSRGSTDQHVFYILWDDLNLLHAFLTNGIEQTGQWKTVAGTALAERLGSRGIPASEIGVRLDLLEVFCELWQEGRGQPVDADALRGSNLRNSKYFDVVVDIASQTGGDAQRLLDELDARTDSRLKGIHNSSVVGLKDLLTDKGYLDERPILDENELRVRALSSPAANTLVGSFANECLHRWWQWARTAVTQQEVEWVAPRGSLETT